MDKNPFKSNRMPLWYDGQLRHIPGANTPLCTQHLSLIAPEPDPELAALSDKLQEAVFAQTRGDAAIVETLAEIGTNTLPFYRRTVIYDAVQRVREGKATNEPVPPDLTTLNELVARGATQLTEAEQEAIQGTLNRFFQNQYHALFAPDAPSPLPSAHQLTLTPEGLRARLRLYEDIAPMVVAYHPDTTKDPRWDAALTELHRRPRTTFRESKWVPEGKVLMFPDALAELFRDWEGNDERG